MIYVDTSVLVSALTIEAKTARMQSWLEAQAVGELAISDWVCTEFSAALSIKLRRGRLTEPQRIAVLERFRLLATQNFVMVPVVSAQFQAAALFADQAAIGLRAGVALHLAITAHHGATIVTLDQQRAKAAVILAVGGILL